MFVAEAHAVQIYYQTLEKGALAVYRFLFGAF